MSLASNFPSVDLPFIDKDTGRINQAWLQFLVSLWNRTGQSGGGPITQVTGGAGIATSVPAPGSAIISLADVDPNDLLANIGFSPAPPTGVTLTQFLDAVLGTAQGSLLTRGSTEWEILDPGANDTVLTAHGPDADLDWEAASGGTVNEISDGTNNILDLSEILFNNTWFTVNDLGNGIGEVDFVGATGSGTVNQVSDGTNVVNDPSEILFNGNSFNVTDLGGGVVQVDDPDSGGGGDGFVWLNTFTASGSASELDCTGFVSATYDVYKFVLTNVTVQTDAASIEMQVGTGGGPTYDTGNNYEWVQRGVDTGGGTQGGAGSAVGFCNIFQSMTNNSTRCAQCEFLWHGFNSTATRKNYHGTSIFVNSDPHCNIEFIGGDWLTTGTAVTAVRFITSSGNITSMTVMVYGLKKS